MRDALYAGKQCVSCRFFYIGSDTDEGQDPDFCWPTDDPCSQEEVGYTDPACRFWQAKG